MINSLVSVVVTCYNHEQYIEQCLKSIFKQSFQHIELHVWNDGSTDQSGEIIEQTLSKSPFSISEYHFQTNQGVVKTRNHALEQIQGEFVLFVDSDNFLEPNYIEVMLEVAIQEQADIIYTNLVDPETGEFVHKAREFVFSDFCQGNYIDSCSLVRVSKIQGLLYDEFLNYKNLEDYDFFFGLITQNGAKPAPVYKTHLNYRVLNSSISSHHDIDKYYESYAYIFSKYQTKNPSLSKSVLDFHFSRLAKLDIEHSINHESFVVTGYSDDGDGETKLVEQRIYKEDFLNLTVEGYDKITIRPSNIPSFYQKLSIVDTTTGQELSPTLSNGLIFDNQMIFHDYYPFIDYDVRNVSQLAISYKRYNISDITSDDYIATVLGTELLDVKKKYSETLLDIVTKRTEYDDLSQRYNSLLQRYNSLLNDYQTVITSRRWTIPTKIINFFRRKK
ncbi:glycosyltransferase family 2 protein [Streptococcus suis]|nr:glycosyltransferase family 2 protein [Streptococcus suis]